MHTAFLLSSILLGAAAPGGHWPAWRGPAASSVSTETGLPLAWSSREGIEWRRELPGWGASTPAIWAEAIFVTAHDGDALLLLCVAKKTGAVRWQRQVGTGSAPRMEIRLKSEEERRGQMFHGAHNLASPSPVTDGERVVVHFGNGDLAAYDFEGNELWKRNLQADHGPYTIWWGHANSPVLHEGLVLSACLQDSLAGIAERLSESYVVAHDAKTGKEVWKTLRMTGATSESCDSYVTPVMHRRGDRFEAIVMGANRMDAYDPETGKQLWFLPGLDGNRVITGTTLGDGLAYTTQGMRGPLVAVKLEPQNSGELGPDSIAWRHAKGTPDTPCPVLWDGILYLVNDNGIATALDANTGAPHWTERLVGDYRASPLAADGRVYFTNMEGLTTVLRAGKAFEKLAENLVEEENVVSSLAVSDGRLFLRGKRALYCIEGR